MSLPQTQYNFFGSWNFWDFRVVGGACDVQYLPPGVISVECDQVSAAVGTALVICFPTHSSFGWYSTLILGPSRCICGHHLVLITSFCPLFPPRLEQQLQSPNWLRERFQGQLYNQLKLPVRRATWHVVSVPCWPLSRLFLLLLVLWLLSVYPKRQCLA